MNRAAEQLLGYSLQGEGLTVGELAGQLRARRPDGRPLQLGELPALGALQGETVQGSLLVLQRPDATLWVSASAAPIPGPDGTPQGVVATLTDITRLVEAEQQLEVAHKELLQQNEELLRLTGEVRQLNAELEQRVQARTAELEAIFASLPDAVVVGNENGITRCNRIALNSFGIERIEDLPGNLGSLRTKVQARYADSGEPIPAENLAFARALGGQAHTQEVIVRNPMTGEDVIQRVAANPIRLNGQVIGAVEINSDITAQKRAQARIAHQANLLETVNDAVIGMDAALHITAWNHAAEELYGWPAEEAIGRYLFDVARSQTSDEERRAVLRALDESGRWRGEAVHLRRDGTAFWVEGTVVASRDAAGRISGYAAANRDMTGRKQAEAALQERNLRLAILHEIDRSILAARAPAEIAQAALDRVQQGTGTTRFAVALFDLATEEAEILAVAGRDAPPLAIGSRWPLSTGWMMEEIRAGHIATISRRGRIAG